MANRRNRFCWIVALLLGAAGCQSEGTGSGGAKPLAASSPNSYVNVDIPTITIEDGNTVIAGTVHRKPGVRWLLEGRVDIEFVAANGEILDELPALIAPRTISMDPNSPSVYSTSYGYIAPAGSTVRVHFVDADTEAREDLEGFDFDGPASDAAAGNVTHGTAGGNTGHTPPAARKGGANHNGHTGGFGMGLGFH